MTAELSQRRQQLIQDLSTPGKMVPPLSINDTALVLECSRWTIQRKIDDRILRKQGGKIPAECVRRQLS